MLLQDFCGVQNQIFQDKIDFVDWRIVLSWGQYFFSFSSPKIKNLLVVKAKNMELKHRRKNLLVKISDQKL